MESEKMLITSSNFVLYDALGKLDNYLAELKLAPKDALHMRLLAEETLGMLRAMAGEYKSLVWFEKEDTICKIKVVAKTEMDFEKKKEILSVSRSGENALAKGFMGKIADIIENGFLNYENVMKLQQEYGGGYVDYAAMGGTTSADCYSWRLEQYRDALDEVREDNDAAKTAWDELEKSIVASLADDVIVGVKHDEVDFTIVSKLYNR